MDTNILINILRKNPRGNEWKNYLADKSIAIASISTFELFLGAELSKKRDFNIKKVQDLVQEIPILPFSLKSSYIAGKIFSSLQKEGNIIELNDIYIGAIALEYNLSIATDNVKNFERITDLHIISI
ncbi:MAG: type II toxin-antitoxin system VapC family toxin [Promethearchaeota archaeon]